MDFESTSRGRNKRPACETALPTLLAYIPSAERLNAPVVLRRHTHRKRNIAASIWGPDLPSTPAASPKSTISRSASASSPKPPFNIYKALLRHPNLFFQFALRLPYPAITALYAIDKEFHYRLNKFSVSLIHDYAKYHAPLSSYIFSWRLYPELCISDPMLRPMDKREWLARDVPGFRWVGMVIWRDSVAKSILTLLALEGLRVPSGTLSTIMKFWSVMEMKTTALRQSFLQDRNIWSDEDLLNFQLFMVKLDMRFADPILGNGACELSHMLLTQKSLVPLWNVLNGKLVLEYDNVTDILVRTYLGADLDTDTHPWLDDETENGISAEEFGLLSRDGWELGGKSMGSGVDMVIKESIERGLNVQQHYLDFVLYGCVDPEMRVNLSAPRCWRLDKVVTSHRDGWPSKDERDKIIADLDSLCAAEEEGDEKCMDTSG